MVTVNAAFIRVESLNMQETLIRVESLNMQETLTGI